MKNTWRIFAAILVLAVAMPVLVGFDDPPQPTDDAKKGSPLMEKAMVILYVADQVRSKAFYRAVLGAEPVLDVPGMTEFALTASASLGLMPEGGTASFLGDKLPPAASGNGIPRCELYLFVAEPAASFAALKAAGGTAVSEPAKRPWGDWVAYGADPDGHVLAFAKPARD
jgi:catechol 2,3-dioxygenase-like lactoylglutathione lyase family enzyme